jgi:hypothetical protein
VGASSSASSREDDEEDDTSSFCCFIPEGYSLTPFPSSASESETDDEIDETTGEKKRRRESRSKERRKWRRVRAKAWKRAFKKRDVRTVYERLITSCEGREMSERDEDYVITGKTQKGVETGFMSYDYFSDCD